MFLLNVKCKLKTNQLLPELSRFGLRFSGQLRGHVPVSRLRLRLLSHIFTVGTNHQEVLNNQSINQSLL